MIELLKKYIRSVLKYVKIDAESYLLKRLYWQNNAVGGFSLLAAVIVAMATASNGLQYLCNDALGNIILLVDTDQRVSGRRIKNSGVADPRFMVGEVSRTEPFRET